LKSSIPFSYTDIQEISFLTDLPITKNAICLTSISTRWAFEFQFNSAFFAELSTFSVIKLTIWAFHFLTLRLIDIEKTVLRIVIWILNIFGWIYQEKGVMSNCGSK